MSRQGVAARELAAEALLAVDTDDAYVNLLLPRLLSRSKLSRRDRAFVTDLTYGCVRGLLTYDWVLARCLTQPLSDLDAPVRALLRLGAHQLLAMDVAPHAAVSATVEAARAFTHRGGVGLVNAILRRLAREADSWIRTIANIDDPLERRAIATSHPRDVVQALTSALEAHGLGGDIDELLAADNRSPWVSLVARPSLLAPEDLADEAERILDADVAAGEISPWAVILSHGDPARLPSLAKGHSAVEDEGSQLVAGIAASVEVGPGPDTTWVDLCAGPGGKTALMAALGGPRVSVIANEIHPRRARLVKDSCRALPTVSVRVGDGVDMTLDTPADRVLVDAPCTGLGSLRRRPESRYRARCADVPVLSNQQVKLLHHALDIVRPGGVVTYATCSPHVAETLKVVERVCQRRGDVEVVSASEVARSLAPAPSLLGSDTPHLQLWPHIHGTDAMFAACLRRK
ncbi:MAG: transcription antitermination factor NusB [Actinomycetaceae bacterium]|nr:transcription antitermination factor NusB [Actinomycetaceae bacterium]